MAIKKLSILFLKDGFSFCVAKDSELIHTEKVRFEASQETTFYELLSQKLDQQLYLNQTYDEVHLAYLGDQFNIIPSSYFEAEPDAQMWLEFNAEIFEGDSIETTELSTYDAELIYAYPLELKEIIDRKFKGAKLESASALFINSFKLEDDKAQVFLNIHTNQLELLAFKNQGLYFYNIFEIATKEDLVYYILNSFKQLELDPNEVEVYYFGGDLEEASLKMLMNFVRHVMPGISNTTELSYYTELQNLS
ncbi:DUF3822 family protein [Weeksellaceae bacterium KMM 9713]|uniref:DUF3822 family protein n=1 Tax=Profundicola chukchiensis TaxID=2961959 RepID=A0A9X4MXH7_9FLAO|nr:DUF3822 family protein [Profundicola chukchiensis]MDG4946671.1 DUF3822 family protein [Profundicola chukchiensis]